MKRIDIVFTSQSGPDGHGEFLYLLRWKDRATQASAWKAFLADPQWIAIKKATSAKYGDLVDDVQNRSLEMLPYTPRPHLPRSRRAKDRRPGSRRAFDPSSLFCRPCIYPSSP